MDIVLLQLMLVALLFAACYRLLLTWWRIPERAALRNLEQSRAVKVFLRDRIYNYLVVWLMDPVAALIPMDLDDELELKAELQMVGINLSPREYHARALILAAYSLVLWLIVPIAGTSPFVLLLTGTITILIYFNFITDHEDRLKEKRRKIRRLLPSFIQTILNSLDVQGKFENEDFIVQADLTKIFQNYLRIAPDVIANDISMLIAEMQASNIEDALHHFADRLNVPSVHFLCDILIGISRGQRQNEALVMLAREMDVAGAAALTEELLLRPGKMKLAILPLVILGITAVIYAIAIDIFNSISFLG